MPTAPRETVLCRYRYDPLDRLVDCAPSAEAGIQRFYCKSRLATEIQGAVQRSVFQHDDQLLAQLRREDVKVETALLATDQQRSVLNVLDANRVHPLAYSPYGHRPAANGLLSLLGFNGERPDPVTGHYLLGNGYRAFNPVLMRFNSPDSLSPFGEGGMNTYGYCEGEPVNRTDPNGHNFFTVSKAVQKFLSLIGRSRTPMSTAVRKVQTLASETLSTVSRRTDSISNAIRPTNRNPMANAVETLYLKRPQPKPALPSYEEAISISPPQYSLPEFINDAEQFWMSREAPPLYFNRPAPRYQNRQVSSATRPDGPPPPVPPRPPETLLPRNSNARGS